MLPQEKVYAETSQAQVLKSFLRTSNAVYNGSVTNYVYSDGSTVQESVTVPASAKWVTAKTIYDGGWGRSSREAFYIYSDGNTITEVSDPLTIPADANWATISRFKIDGTTFNPEVAGQVYNYSLDGIEVLSGSSIPAYAVWGTFAGSTDGWSAHSHSEIFENYDLDYEMPTLTGVTIQSDNSASGSFAETSDTITAELTTDGPIDHVIAAIAGRSGTVEKLNDSHWKATLQINGTEAEGDISLLVELFTSDGYRISVNETTDGSKVTYDKTGPSIETTYSSNWMTNEDVTINANVTDPGSGVVEIKWAAGEWTAATFPADGQALTDSFTVDENGIYTIYARDTAGNESVNQVDVYQIDKEKPMLLLEASPSGPTNGEVTVIVTTNDTDSDIDEAMWATGERDEEYFADEGEELELFDPYDMCDDCDIEWDGYRASFTANMNGAYTVYVRDEAGNEKIETINVTNIITDQPAITLNADPVTTTDGTVTITAAVAVSGAGIGNDLALIKWEKGSRDANYFTAGGTDITVGKQFTATENGDYTVFAKDIAGNSNTEQIHVANITPKATVNFNSNGGSTVSAQTVTVNGHAIEPTVPMRTGFTFGGWYSESSLTNVFNFAGTTIISDTTLYAKWTANSNSQPGTGSSNGSIGDITVPATNGQLTLPAGKTGEVSLGDAITVSIPADASGKELKLTIEKVLDAQKLLTEKDVLASPIYEILKNFSENFSKPVTLTLAFDPVSLKNNQRATVFYYDEVKKKWEEVGGRVNGNHIIVEVNHFTKFAVFAVDIVTEVPETDTKPNMNFSDIAGHWAEANIKQAVKSGIVTGFADGLFKPNRAVTRAEFAVMLMNMLKPQVEGAALTFTDTAKIGSWAQKAVAQEVQAGIINGYKDGTFRPGAPITRAEMAVMIANALDLKIPSNTETGFADDKDIPAWAKGAVAAVKELGLVQGKGAGRFAPKGETTRAEAVTVLLKMLTQNK